MPKDTPECYFQYWLSVGYTFKQSQITRQQTATITQTGTLTLSL